MNRISVAVTAYNGSRYIIEQLESIRLQTLPVDEVIICDDKSNDDTYSIVSDYIFKHELKQWKIFTNKKRLGFCDNFWKAIDICAGEVIFLCDQDDVWYPDKVRTMFNILNDDHDIKMLASSYDLCDSDGDIVKTKLIHNRSNDDGTIEIVSFGNLISTSAIRGCSIAFRKDILYQEIRMNLQNGLGHDWLISCYAGIKGQVLVYNKRLFKYRQHSTNVSHDNRSYIGKLTVNHKRKLAIKDEYAAMLMINDRVKKIPGLNKSIMSQLKFVEFRNRLLNDGEILLLFALFFYIRKYINIYNQGFFGYIKGYFGDFLYSIADKINVLLTRIWNNV